MSIPGNVYAPPGVYTETLFENPIAGLLQGLKIPVLIGTGSETLFQDDLELVRGSSASVDQQVVQEDATGRAVVSISATGVVTLGAFNGSLTKIQSRHYPIVNGKGTGTTTVDRGDVSVTINGSPIVVVSVSGSNGVIELAQAPKLGDTVRVTYFHNRTDTAATDTLSSQVTTTAAQVYAAKGGPYTIVLSSDDELKVTVDGGSETTITLPPTAVGATWTAAEVVGFINASAPGTLVASTYTDEQGLSSIKLTSDHDIVIGSGSANAPLGFVAGTDTARNKTFYTNHGPIVTGDNGGVATTDVDHVTVTVDGAAVIPTSVDGANRKFTLAQAPKSGAVVKATYKHNTWQNTYDYLAHIGVTDVTLCGSTPGAGDFVENTDFVLKDDTIIWGTSALVSTGIATQGKTAFGSSQVSTTLVDQRAYMDACTAKVDTSVSPSLASTTVFVLPRVPTTGNGRNSPLGSSLFQTVSNGRIDLPTDRPDLVTAYWGYDIQDALDRGAVTVTKVDSATKEITLQSAVPVGATVYATYYYNTLVDDTYTLGVQVSGASGTGSYTITDKSGNSVYTPSFGTKSSGLNTVTVEFPSGAESTADCRFEGSTGDVAYTGPVEETVTVTFKNKAATPAKYAVPGAGPYEFINDKSDKFRLQYDGSNEAGPGAQGVDLANPTAKGSGAIGHFGHILGDEIAYDASTGNLTHTLTSANNGFNLTVDGVSVTGTVAAGAGKAATDWATAINTAAKGTAASGTAQAGAATTITLAAGASAVDDFYNGWEVHITANTGVGQTRTITDYNGTTKVATVATWTVNPDNTSTYDLHQPGGEAVYTAATKFTSNVTIAANEFDDLTVNYVDNAGTTATTVTIAAGTYTASTLAAAVTTALATIEECQILCVANSDGQLQFKFRRGAGATHGYIEFVTDGTPAEDFAILAGIDTAAAGGGQTKIMDGDIARAFTLANHDRLMLRNRVIPGIDGSLAPEHLGTQASIKVEGSSGAAKFGITAGTQVYAGGPATVRPATLYGHIGLAGGQVASGDPQVKFYDGTGATAANNLFKFTLDGTAVTVDFSGVDSANGTARELGIAYNTANSVFKDIVDAMAATGVWGNAAAINTAKLVRREGAGFRITSNKSTADSSVIIGTGSANSTLGFSDGQAAYRTLPSVDQVAAALMMNTDAAANWALDIKGAWTPAAGYFATEVLAGKVTDGGGKEYLYLQSQLAGSSSSVTFQDATANGVQAQGTGLGVIATNGAVGEAAISGFVVTSSDGVNGSGTKNDSILGSGSGQDGNVGQTYRDKVTGLVFTVLPRPGNALYTANETFTFNVRKAALTDANVPTNAIPGVELLVTNTTDMAAGDTALVQCFERGGNEPQVGELYYVSYTYNKQDFSTKLYSKFSAIESEFGALSPNNPTTLAANMAMLNGAVLLGVKQVKKDAGLSTAGDATYKAAIDDLAGNLPGGVAVDLLVPLTGSSDVAAYVKKHCALQSSPRYRAERTAIMGFGAGTTPSAAGLAASAVGDQRVRFVYPDMALLTITDALGSTKEHLVDGTYLAAAMAGSVASPNSDVATPWTGKQLVGFKQLGRTLDSVEMNQIAVKGVTVLEDRNPFLRVRHGLTSDMTNILTKTPTVIQIADEVQRRCRQALDPFIGVKFLPGILSQVEGRLSKVLQGMVAEQLIVAFQGVSAKINADDPTAAEIEAYYAPVFPLLYISARFSLRSQL